MACRTR